MSEKTHDALNATLELARKLLARKGASVDELEQATAALPNAIASAERQHGALTEHRRATLVSGSDADLVKVDNEIGAAARLLDRLRAIAEELDARLSQAREQASDAARARNRAKIISERDAVVDRLRKEYPEHALAIAAMLGDLARVDVNIGEFNRTAPAHEKIQGAENLARHRDFAPREELGRKIVHLWCEAGTTHRIPDEHQARVVKNVDGTGLLPLPPSVSGFAQPCVLAKFECIEFRRAEQAASVQPLAVNIDLPGLVAGDRPFWRPAEYGTTAFHWAQMAERLRAEPSAPRPPRPIEVEYRLIKDDAANGARPAMPPAAPQGAEFEGVELDIARRASRQ